MPSQLRQGITGMNWPMLSAHNVGSNNGCRKGILNLPQVSVKSTIEERARSPGIPPELSGDSHLKQDDCGHSKYTWI